MTYNNEVSVLFLPRTSSRIVDYHVTGGAFVQLDPVDFQGTSIFIGSGKEPAQIAFHALDELELSIERKLQLAIETASKFDRTVGGRIVYERLP